MRRPIPENALTTPVLVTVFNRPDHTKKVLAEIGRARLTTVYVSGDGPRPGHEDDRERCAEVRALFEDLDWDCEVHARFQERNQGVKLGMSSAIDWFFSEIEEGIILEDDCLPGPSFFRFCQALLAKYRDDERVMQISGSNYLLGKHTIDASYYFSKINDVWGWATWRRAWNHFDLRMPKYPRFRDEGQIHNYLGDPRMASWLSSYFEDACKVGGAEGIWSSAWAFALAEQNGLTAVPRVNLVQNIGVMGEGTHTGETFRAYGEVGRADLGEIVHPEFVLPDRIADRLRFQMIEKTDPRLARVGPGVKLSRLARRLIQLGSRS